ISTRARFGGRHTCVGHRETAFARALGLTLELASSGRCQARGGRKGGLVARAWTGSLAAYDFVPPSGATSGAPDSSRAYKPKPVATQPADAWHSVVIGLDGMPAGSQQSCADVTAISDAAGSSCGTAKTPAHGAIDNDSVTRNVNMIRPMRMC